jgi:hypothetical protein
MYGEQNLIRAGYAWHVFAYFSCNSSGVRIAVRKTEQGAVRYGLAFARRNNVQVAWSLKHTPGTE